MQQQSFMEIECEVRNIIYKSWLEQRAKRRERTLQLIELDSHFSINLLLNRRKAMRYVQVKQRVSAWTEESLAVLSYCLELLTGADSGQDETQGLLEEVLSRRVTLMSLGQ